MDNMSNAPAAPISQVANITWKSELPDIADIYEITTPTRRLLGVAIEVGPVLWRITAVLPLFSWLAPPRELGFRSSYELYLFDEKDRARVEGLLKPAIPRYFKIYAPQFEETEWRRTHRIISKVD